MLRPTGLFPGKVLLLAGHHSFNAAYIRRTLEFCGASVLMVDDAPNRSLAGLADEDLAAIVGCVAIDLDPDSLASLLAQRLPFPLLFVGGITGAPLPGPYTWMQAPFASYQVIEWLTNLIPAPGRAFPAP